MVAKSFSSHRFRSEEWDVINDPVHQDALTIQGLIRQITLCLRCKDGALAHWATVCSTWTFMGRDATDRSFFWPLGSKSCKPAQAGNTQAARMSLCLFLLYALGVHFILEQPSTSCMKAADWIVWLRQEVRIWFTHTWMGMFNGPTAKGTELLSASYWPSHLHRKRDVSRDPSWKPTDLVRHEAPTNSSRIRVTGIKDPLKGSQAYPAFIIGGLR